MTERGARSSKSEQRIRALLESTAAVRGEAFFAALVQGLAKALGTKYASVCVLRDDDELEALALWDGKTVTRGMRQPLEGTP